MNKRLVLLSVFCLLVIWSYGQSKGKVKQHSANKTNSSAQQISAKGLSPQATALLGDLVLLNRPLTLEDIDLMQKYKMELVDGYLCVPAIITLKDSVDMEKFEQLKMPVVKQDGERMLVNVPVITYVDFARSGITKQIQLAFESSDIADFAPISDASADTLNKQGRYDEMLERIKSYYTPEQGFFQKAFTDKGDPHFMISDNKGNFKFGIGGNVHFTFFYDIYGSVDDNAFTTAAISVPTDKTNQIGFSKGGSKLNFRAIGKIGKRNMLGFIEFGVGTSGNVINLRHAYFSFGGLTVGQTWSLFMDLAAGAQTVDLEGPNTQIACRHPLIAYTLQLGKSWQIAFSAEMPGLSYAFDKMVGLNAVYSIEEEFQNIPDFVIHGKYKGDIGHVQVGAIFRYLSYYNYDYVTREGYTERRFGWGASASGSLFIAKKCIFSGQFFIGKGIASYVNDLAAAQVDLVKMTNIYTGEANMETAPMTGFYVSLQALWSAKLSSSFIYGYTNLFQYKNQRYGDEDRFLKSTHYAAVNLFWEIHPDLTIGAEYLFGMKNLRYYGSEPVDKSELSGMANRLDFMLNYSF